LTFTESGISYQNDRFFLASLLEGDLDVYEVLASFLAVDGLILQAEGAGVASGIWSPANDGVSLSASAQSC